MSWVPSTCVSFHNVIFVLNKKVIFYTSRINKYVQSFEKDIKLRRLSKGKEPRPATTITCYIYAELDYYYYANLNTEIDLTLRTPDMELIWLSKILPNFHRRDYGIIQQVL